MCKFESSQKNESRAQSADSSKTYRKPRAFKYARLNDQWRSVHLTPLRSASTKYWSSRVSDGIRPVRTGSQEPVLRISLIPRTGCWLKSEAGPGQGGAGGAMPRGGTFRGGHFWWKEGIANSLSGMNLKLVGRHFSTRPGAALPHVGTLARGSQFFPHEHLIL